MRNFFAFVMLYVLCSATAIGADGFTPSKIVSYKCGGTEPFWDMTISPKGISLNEMAEERKSALPYVKPMNAKGLKDGFLRVYQSGKITMVVRYNEKGCSDDMSDDLYKFDVTVIAPDGVLFGCCNPL